MNQHRLEKALKIWRVGPVLDKDEYHNSQGYLSNSFIGDFIKCEYGALIKYTEKKASEFKEAFAVGHLVEELIFNGESGFTKKVESLGEHAVTRAGKERAFVVNARQYAKSVTRHKGLVDLFRSEGSVYHQVITFELHGVQWRGEIDYLNLNKETEIDLKTTKADFQKLSFNTDTRQYDMTFIDEWNYHRQRALYQHGIIKTFGKKVQPRILAVSKQNKSVRMFKFDDQDRLNRELDELFPVVERYKSILQGAEVTGCGSCATCVEDETIDDVMLNEISTSAYCAKG